MKQAEICRYIPKKYEEYYIIDQDIGLGALLLLTEIGRIEDGMFI